jgi:phosphate-selective porin OprO/OprP
MWTDPRKAAHRACALAALSVLVAWLPTAAAQQAGAPNLPALPAPAPHPGSAAPAADALLERLRKMEERLDQVTRQNEELARENSMLAGQVQDLSRRIGVSPPQATMTGAFDGATSSGMAGADLPPGTLVVHFTINGRVGDSCRRPLCWQIRR